MASIYRRKNYNGKGIYRMVIRRVGIPIFTLSFDKAEDAHKWARENERKYIENPGLYLENARSLRLKMKREREFNQ